MLPLNLLVALPTELEPALGRVSAQITDHLKARGKSVIEPGVYESRQLWVEAVSRAKQAAEGSGFEDAVKILIGLLHEHHRFDAVVIPSIVYRSARPQGFRTMRWDGVKRAVGVRVSGTTMVGTLHGAMGGVSLHLFVHDARGQRVFENFGGLDLAHEIEARRTEWRWRVKDEVLADPAALREGIGVAFTPYLPPPAPTPAGGP